MQEAKLNAKKENRTLIDTDAKTACQQACPARAIEFGNVNNRNSAISNVRNENLNRTFYVLEPIHTLPNINYLVKVRNTDILTVQEGQHNKLKEQSTATEKHG